MRTGTTLLELVVALLLVGVLTGLSLPPVGRLRDRAVALEGRERFVTLVRETRRVAIERGGARLVLDAERTAAAVVAGADTLRRHQWNAPDGLALEITGGRRHATLHFDAAGIGRFTSLTVTFGRPPDEAVAVVSSYGRVRRR